MAVVLFGMVKYASDLRPPPPKDHFLVSFKRISHLKVHPPYETITVKGCFIREF